MSEGTAAGARAPGGDTVDWVIVGGGPHGVCAGRALVASGASLRIVEPSGRLLDRWTARASAVGMVWMRSPLMHHLDALPVSLHHFLHRPENADVADLAGMFRRPTHDAFLRHSKGVVEETRLDEALVAGRVDAIRSEHEHLVVEGDGVRLRARRVLVATGSNAPCSPPWARELQAQGAPIHHAFDPASPLHHAVLGRGISAVQRALLVHRTTRRPVRRWARGPVQVAEFDFDRAWTKHRFVLRWAELDDAERFEFLERHPHRGSVPKGLAVRLDRAVRRGSIELEQGEMTAEWDPASEHLVLCGERRTVDSDGLTLATGLQDEAVAGWLRSTAEALELPMARGLPRLDAEMHWGHGSHVTGPLARLRLGPMASNLVGARWATSYLPGVRMQPV